MKRYPNGQAVRADGIHAWTPEPHHQHSDKLTARCGAPIEPTPIIGLFDPHDESTCRACASGVLDERLPAVRR